MTMTYTIVITFTNMGIPLGCAALVLLPRSPTNNDKLHMINNNISNIPLNFFYAFLPRDDDNPRRVKVEALNEKEDAKHTALVAQFEED